MLLTHDPCQRSSRMNIEDDTEALCVFRMVTVDRTRVGCSAFSFSRALIRYVYAPSFPISTKLARMPSSHFRTSHLQAMLSHYLDFPVVFLLLSLAFIAYRKRRRYNFPPGPRGWPLVGNLFDVPRRDPWLEYLRMSHELGAYTVSR